MTALAWSSSSESFAGAIPGGEGAAHAEPGMGLVGFFIREVVGGVALGLGLGFVGYHMLSPSTSIPSTQR
jgi:NhaP-type Na+/H+ or K+/H+ antiporter